MIKMITTILDWIFPKVDNLTNSISNPTITTTLDKDIVIQLNKSSDEWGIK